MRLFRGMRLFLVLLLALVAGCVDMPADVAAADLDAGGSTSCAEEERVLHEWASPDSGDPSTSATFEAPSGVWSVDVEWTPPESQAGGYRARILDPAGDERFVDMRGRGASAGMLSVSLDGQTSSEDDREPAPAGTYTFEFESGGFARGAALRVVASGCW